MIMKGYDDDPEATARTIDPDGWLHTGDLATMRPDRYFHITGRLKEMIIRGGENVYPREIEEFLHTHPDIADVYVVGLPDERLGESVLAWIRLKAGRQMTADDVRRYCRGRIAHFKVPEHIRFVESFPMTVTGKVQKFRIREQEIAERGAGGNGGSPYRLITPRRRPPWAALPVPGGCDLPGFSSATTQGLHRGKPPRPGTAWPARYSRRSSAPRSIGRRRPAGN